MGYLEPAEYVQYGLDAETADSTVAAASAMMNVFCRRQGLSVESYTEQIRLRPGAQSVRISALPLVSVTSLRVRASKMQQSFALEPLQCVIAAFGLQGEWTELDVSAATFTASGEIALPQHLFAVFFDEVEVGYTAGYSEVPAAVKVACAQVVRNAQATPALNLKRTGVSAMQMEYFSGSLLDESTKTLLKPYIAERMA